MADTRCPASLTDAANGDAYDCVLPAGHKERHHFDPYPAGRDALVEALATERAALAAAEARCAELNREAAKHRSDLAAAAGERLVPLPEPHSDLARVVSANVLLRASLSRCEEGLRGWLEWSESSGVWPVDQWARIGKLQEASRAALATQGDGTGGAP